ncbi:MAG: ABC transporter ATP-binding protein [Nitrospiraceae bacterium]
MADVSVETRGLVKRYGHTLAVDSVSLEIRRGEFFSLLGPSGAGKTSVLRMVGGFERPDAGEVLIDGRSMADVPPNRRPVNLVFQSYALFPHLSVFDNVAFGLEMQRVSRADIPSRVRSALDMVKLSTKHGRLPSQLSGGEQQRVAVARALVNRPAVVLLDEPLAALDQQLRQEMRVELKAIQAQVGTTFVCVTHHQEEALTMSDRVAVINAGRVLQVGRPQDIYESPATAFVARFVGVSNEIAGLVQGIEDGRGTLAVPECPDMPPIHVQGPTSLVEGSRMTLWLRPERLHLSTQAGSGGFENNVAALVEKVLYNGSETQYLLRLPGRLLWTARIPNEYADQKRFSVGETVSVRWSAAEGVMLPE